MTKNKKIGLFILIIFLIGWVAALFDEPAVENKQDAIDLKKTVACATANIDLEKKYPGSRVWYNDSTLIVSLPLNVIVKYGNVSPDIFREDLEYLQIENGNIDEIMEEFIGNFIRKGQHVKSKGFYYLKVIIKDDYDHDGKEYSSSEWKI